MFGRKSHPLIRWAVTGTAQSLASRVQQRCSAALAALQPADRPPPNPNTATAKGDPVIYYTPLYGQPNISDSAWHDDTGAFIEYGPITAVEMYHSGSADRDVRPE